MSSTPYSDTRMARSQSPGDSLGQTARADYDAITFAEAWKAWRAHRASGSRPLARSTLEDYDSMYRRYVGPFFEDLVLDDIDVDTVAEFQLDMQRRGVSAVRYGKLVVPLRACLRWHFRCGRFPNDTRYWFDQPAPAADERRVLTFEEGERLIHALPEFYRPIVTCAVYTGLRLGELRALTWSDIDLETGIVHVRRAMDRNEVRMYTKTKGTRSVGIPTHLDDVLRTWRAACPPSSQDLVFPQPNGRVLDPNTFRKRVFKPALVRAGLDPAFRIHDLRHTAASWYVRAGVSVIDLMRVFGWTQLQTALRYMHTLDTPTVVAALLSESRASLANAGPHPMDKDAAVHNRLRVG